MDSSSIRGCFLIVLLCVVVDIILDFGGAALIDSFKDKGHCTKCGREIDKEKYCPDCGTPTDSLNYYDYWNRPK